ncbi:ATP-dependent protease [Naegleria gruberi]|uniref:ATP-dependent protease n=1 Tax=Naegleria gruberi TaxID=5762 RepID=D2VRJ3_NAEGR|nr:ATP-dependent protease [Naegleria gruberi]EFC40612.1 ATP-dependent protease [Naegleria gruberi]|eukprot:XP_002673356.1 ATP-dependent protease [Naegleria gruberi strain NEG-M]
MFITSKLTRMNRLIASNQNATNVLLKSSQQRLFSTLNNQIRNSQFEDEETSETKTEEEKSIEEILRTKTSLTPSEIVSQLDRNIVGQADAKRAVAVALRNRWRRQQLDSSIKDEIIPKNILMVGPTGVGKTEIARRLSKLANAPFIKTEATKYTEVGFHGSDVDSIIRDLVEVGIQHTKDRLRAAYKTKAREFAENKIIETLTGKKKNSDESLFNEWRKQLRSGVLDDKEIEVELPVEKPRGLPGAGNMQGRMPPQVDIQDLLSPLFGGSGSKTKKRRMKIKECLPKLEESEVDKLLQTDVVIKEAIRSVEEDGIVFIDEIDKICSSYKDRHDASSEGVQRDLLPIIEGTTVSTKYGNVKTDHILFIACGAFHSVKPSDMLAELQGRLPIRVELKGLTEKDFNRVLTEPETNILRQNIELLKTEGVDLEFTPSGVNEIAKVAFEVNTTIENIGARRLITIVEKILEEISFNAPSMSGQKVVITDKEVQQHVGALLKKSDLKKFIL